MLLESEPPPFEVRNPEGPAPILITCDHAGNRIPKQLEIGARWGIVDPNRGRASDLQKEAALVVNWFFYGHGNKLTFDTSRYSLGQLNAPDLNDTQIRLQWDVSF